MTARDEIKAKMAKAQERFEQAKANFYAIAPKYDEARDELNEAKAEVLELERWSARLDRFEADR